MSWLPEGHDAATYAWVREYVLNYTELGYTQRSKDRVWVVVCFDVWTDVNGPDRELYGNLIYSQGDYGSYDLWEKELCFDSRRGAQAHADERNARSRERTGDETTDIWMPANLGDLDRFETAYLDGRGLLTRGRFRGSDRALAARARFWTEYFERTTKEST